MPGKSAQNEMVHGYADPYCLGFEKDLSLMTELGFGLFPFASGTASETVARMLAQAPSCVHRQKYYYSVCQGADHATVTCGSRSARYNNMPWSTDRRFEVRRGLPPILAAGNIGASISHCVSVKLPEQRFRVLTTKHCKLNTLQTYSLC